MYWTKSWSFTLQAIVSWQCCSCLYQAPTTSHQGRRGVADGQWNKLGGERKLDDSEICSSKRKTRRRGSSWARSRHRWSFWWSGGERRHPRAQESETQYHAGGVREDQGRHCWSAVENHSQDWKTCTTNQRIPSEGPASVQGWWIPALASSSFPVHDDKLDVVYCGTGETGTISKSGLSNVLPFNEENILKLRLDSNKRLAKALQAARDYMWYHSDKTIIFSTPAICGNVYYGKYSVLQHFLSLPS